MGRRGSSSSSSSMDSIRSSRSGILSDGILSGRDNFTINTNISSNSSGGSLSSGSLSGSSLSGGSMSISSDSSISSSCSSYDFEELPIFDINTHRLLNDMDDKDTNDLEDLMVIGDAINGKRKERWNHQRMIWDEHIQQLMHEEAFENEYRTAFCASNVNWCSQNVA